MCLSKLLDWRLTARPASNTRNTTLKNNTDKNKVEKLNPEARWKRICWIQPHASPHARKKTVGVSFHALVKSRTG